MIVRTESEVGVVDLTMDGKALTLNEDELSARCEAHGITPLLTFLSPSVEQQLAALASFGIEDVTPVPEQWFSPEAGLATTAVLLQLIPENAEGFYEPEALIRDVQRLQEILIALRRMGVRWHLDADF